MDCSIEQTEARAYNVVGITRGTDTKLRNSYIGIGMHHDHIGMGRPVDHDSMRAFNAVVRVRGADDLQHNNMSNARWATIGQRIDSLHKKHGGPRLDSSTMVPMMTAAEQCRVGDRPSAGHQSQAFKTQRVVRVSFSRGKWIIRRAVLLRPSPGAARFDCCNDQHGLDGAQSRRRMRSVG